MDKETRTEQFKEAGIAYTMATRPNVICGNAFTDDDVIKQLNRSPQFEAGAEYGYNFAIEQACEWLDEELPKYVMEGREGKPYISVALIDEFKKAMSGR